MADKPDPNGDAPPAGDPTPPPNDRPPGVLPYASPPGRVNFKTLRRMPSFEANLAAAKLEAAGVPSFVADENIAVAHPLAFSQVRLQVAEADFHRAEQILDAPAPARADDDEEEEDDDDHGEGEGGRRRKSNEDDEGEFVEEAYRCPRCHRKAVDLLPLSHAMRRTRLGCFAVLLLPAFVGVIGAVVPGLIPRGDYPPMLILAWAVVLGVLAFILLTARRAKRCRDCGLEWANPAEA